MFEINVFLFFARFLGETERCHFLGGQTTTKKKADEQRNETTFATLNNRIFFFQFCRLPFLDLFCSHYVNNTTERAESVCILNTSQRPFVSRRRRRREEAQSSSSIRIRIMTGGGSYDEVDLEDMDWNESLKEFTYSCPCGDIFRITLEELKDGEEIARCPSCSLVLTVIYDPDELPSITNVEAATSGTTEEIA